jgi:starvation-inducible DNA-binding protein
MLSELRDDNSLLTRYMRETHEICAKHNDVATTVSSIHTSRRPERRTWFLAEAAAAA